VVDFWLARKNSTIINLAINYQNFDSKRSPASQILSTKQEALPFQIAVTNDIRAVHAWGSIVKISHQASPLFPFIAVVIAFLQPNVAQPIKIAPGGGKVRIGEKEVIVPADRHVEHVAIVIV
jgi:hypothetical protein